MTFIVGLTGGIGSGKTAVSTRLAKLGATIVDADEISRALTAAGGAAMDRVREAFGARYVGPDGALDRAAMRTLAFEDPAARAKLEAILHPAVRGEADRALAAASGPYAVLVVPLLLETGGYAGRVDRILVVDCAETLQVERASARSRIAADDVRRIMGAQWPRWRRLQLADDVAWNGGDLAALDRQCASLHDRYAGASRAVH
jgi:dephospho-CoA kinase